MAIALSLAVRPRGSGFKEASVEAKHSDIGLIGASKVVRHNDNCPTEASTEVKTGGSDLIA